MRERPILFSSSMVKALIAGTKTQTRRLATHRHGINFIGGKGEENDASLWGYFFDGPDHNGYMVLGRGLNERSDHGRISLPCPYGEVGDRLWVRETWAPVDFLARGHELHDPIAIGYRADCTAISHERGNVRPLDVENWGWDKVKWRPSIFMPRWASRITLEVVSVRVERLRDISEGDAAREGVETATDARGYPSYRVGFKALWDEINSERAPWALNPFVWCVAFKLVQPTASAP